MRAGATLDSAWHVAGTLVPLDRPVLVGILNVTPDSFFDGGRHLRPDAALRRAAQLIEEGALILDVGGESTRPGAAPVAPSEELARVLPIITALRREWPDLPLSVDTVKAAVADAALQAGASIINDVSALRLDAGTAAVVARHGAGLILMHSRGGVATMAGHDHAAYAGNPIDEVRAELAAAVDAARAAGVADACIVLDPGFGFAKHAAHSVAVLADLPRLGDAGFPLLVGPSRKRFVDTTGSLPPAERLPGTVAACVLALLAGARLFRVHDVAAVRQALDLAHAVQLAGARP